MTHNMDCRKKSIAKSVTFRVVSIAMLTGVTFTLTGNLMDTAYITAFFQAFMTMFYYAHERAWASMPMLVNMGSA